MFWKTCLIVVSMILMSACSLNQAASEGVTELTPASLDVTATFTPTALPATATPLVQSTSTPIPIQTSNIENVAPVQTNNTTTNAVPCTVTRTDLPLYTVVAGDTLSNIARRTNSTVNELAQINCIADASQIAVGQQLRVLQAPSQTTNTTVLNNNQTNNTTSTTTSSNVTIIDTTGRSGNNAIEISPYLSNKISNNVGHYTFRQDTSLTLSWLDMPTNLGLIQVEFIYVDDHYTVSPISIGIDTNLADGASITWHPQGEIIGRIFATARIPGQYHEGVQSGDIRIQSLPNRIGPRGALSAYPNSQAGTPADWGDYIIEPNVPVTITWSGIDPPEYEKVGRVEFQYLPDTGGIQILGHDTNKNDGISFTWTPPADVSGRIAVGGSFGSNRESWIFAPDIHVRTPDTNVTPCEFNPFGIGGDVPVYPIPNLTTEPITNIQTGTTYPKLGQGGSWTTEFGGSGIFYHIDLGYSSGWVQDGRGELIGDCEYR